MSITIRRAAEADAPALLAIYAHYAAHTAISFECAVPSLEEFTQRIRATLLRYPYLVAISDGQIVGYAYAGPFGARAAFAWSAETSIYVAPDCRRGGVGRALYAALEEILVRQNIANLYAVIADPPAEDEYLTRDSERFHAALGYRTVGRYRECGSKFGRWYNVIVMEKVIGAHSLPPDPVIPFARLGAGDL